TLRYRVRLPVRAYGVAGRAWTPATLRLVAGRRIRSPADGRLLRPDRPRADHSAARAGFGAGLFHPDLGGSTGGLETSRTDLAHGDGRRRPWPAWHPFDRPAVAQRRRAGSAYG